MSVESKGCEKLSRQDKFIDVIVFFVWDDLYMDVQNLQHWLLKVGAMLAIACLLLID